MFDVYTNSNLYLPPPDTIDMYRMRYVGALTSDHSCLSFPFVLPQKSHQRVVAVCA
jgi:hypothetical protein